MHAKTWTRMLTMFGVALTGLVWLGACERKQSAGQKEITIGAIFPLTGDAAQWGIPPRKGAELAVEEINAAGGVNGKRLRLVVEDTACDARQGTSAFNKLLTVEKPAVVIGGVCSAVTLAVAPIAERNSVVLISPASTNPKITDAGDFIFRVIPSDALRGQVFAEYLYQDAGLRRVAYLYINNESGVGNREAFKSRFTELGGQVLLEEAYSQQATEVRTQLTKVKASDAEALVVCSFPNDTIIVMKQARELDLGKPLYFQTEAVEDANVLREAGPAAHGAVYILAAPAEGDAAAVFAAAYRQRFDTEPELFAAEAYDVVRLIASAAAPTSTAPFTADAFRSYLSNLSEYNGASGTLSFDHNGDVVKPMAIKRINNGKPEVVSVR